MRLRGIAIAMLVALTGCSLDGINLSSSGDVTFRYGNFCGKNWPVLTASTPMGKVAELQAIQPYDSLDAACKQHDICYATNGFSNPACDDILLKQMTSMGFRDPRCSMIARNIGAFALSNPGQFSFGRLNINVLLNGPLVAAESIIEVPLTVVSVGMGAIPMERPRCIAGTGTFRTHVQEPGER